MLMLVHISAVILLFLLALISIFISVYTAAKPDVDQTNKWLLNIANTIWLIENIVAGIVTLTGLIAMYVGSWSLSQPWLWLSLLIMVFYSLTLFYITKPVRLAPAEGGSAFKVGMQVLLRFIYLLLIAFTSVLMLFKPF